MEMEIIENIESVLPLFQITGNGILPIANTEKSRINKLSVNNVVKRKKEFIASQDGFQEGGFQEIILEIQKRDSRLRAQAIERYGYSCYICGFNFSKVYGEFGDGYIEVHHLIPLSNAKGERINTTDDVCVVCANCHRVLHRNGKEPIPLDVLKNIVEQRRNSITA